ncbi:MAG: helix-turn-helix transcriptional regulator [Magnetococcales bacterium]|nr:helix-turn-helix transcriptional regulator [Magnetococcales bacterium]
MLTNLRPLIKSLGKTQAELARALKLSEAAISQLINHDKWPAGDREECATRIRAQLQTWGADPLAIQAAFTRINPKQVQSSAIEEENPVYLRHQRLHPEAKKRLKLFRDPFNNDIT